MSGRIAIIGLTLLAFLALGAGTGAVTTTAKAEFRVPGLFGGKKTVKRRRYRRPPLAQPVRNPDRTFAAVSAKAVSPDVAKNSDAVVGIGTASAAAAVMALPAPKAVAASVPQTDSEASDGDDAEAKTAEDVDDKSSEETEIASASDAADAEGAESESGRDTASESGPQDGLDEEESDAAAKATDGAGEDSANDTDPNKDDDETVVASLTPDDAEIGSDAAEPKPSDTEAAEKDQPGEETADSKTPDGAEAADETAESSAQDEASDAKPAKAGDDKADEAATAKEAADDDAAADSKTAESKAEDAKSSEQKAADEKTVETSADTDVPVDAKTAKPEDGQAEAAADEAPETAADERSEGKEADGAEATARAENAEPEPASDKVADADEAGAKDKNAKDENAKDEIAEDAAEVEESDAKDASAKLEDAKEPDAKDLDKKNSAPKEADAAEADTKDLDGKDAESKPSESKDVAGSGTEPADKEATPDGEIVTASLPPAPEPKPEIARMASPANTPERLAEAASDAQDDEASDAGDEDVTASIAPASKPDVVAASDEAADVTGVARAAAEAAGEDEFVLDPRAYDATVVLDVSPPPGKDTETDDTKVASLNPGSAPAADGVSASGDAASEVVDLGPPPPPPVDPVIAAVRSKLDGPGAPKVVDADLEALKALYGERDEDLLWVSGDSLTPKAKSLIATIRDADDWGLDADAYAVPSPGDTLSTDEARADAELALSAAVLKYARHAQTGRLTPSKAHKLFDFNPTARDPKTVLTEIAASSTPDKALLALHPQNEQYQSLHAALVHARDSAKDLGRNPDNDRTVQLITINMERWRWLPSDLGKFHVWNNIPEFKFRVLKNGKEIYEEKTIVGQTKYATAFFSAPMRNIVFNPNWTVPPTIVKEDIAPKLKGPQRSGGLFGGRESRNRMLRRYGLTVSKGGKPVDADQVDWQTANVHAYTFQQDPGPHNVLGQFKFNFPNKHAIYMHDTTQKELFGRRVRTLSHGCIRVNQPTRFAAFLLAEDKGWSMRNVQDVFARAEGQTKVISLSRNIPVHLTYNTAIADGYGSIREFGDVYGIDNRMAAQLFKNPAHFNGPFSGAEFAETAPTRSYSEPRPRRRRSAGGVDNFLSGILGN